MSGSVSTRPSARRVAGRRCGRPPILLVTAGLPNPDVLELVRLGVAGIVHKHHTPDALHRSITQVPRGAVHIEQRYLQNLIESANRQARAAALHRASAKWCGCCWRAVERGDRRDDRHLRECVKATLQQRFAKTGVRTRSQLVRIALEQRDAL